MLGLPTYEAVMLLTRHRLRGLQAVLDAKVKSGFAVNDLERRVAALAARAVAILEDQPHPPDTSVRPVARGVSRYAALGAMGPEIPRFAAFYAPGQSWLADTIHRGNPDPDREMLLTRSTDFLVRFWTKVSSLIDADKDIPAQATEKEKSKDTVKSWMRAYVLGHTCHIAADVVLHPFVRRLEWRLGDAAQKSLTPDQVTGAIDAAVAQRVFGLPETRGKTWSGLLPSADEIPGPFFDAYNATLEEVFGTGALREGSLAFQKQFKSDNPPSLSVKLLKDGYSSFQAILERKYTWTYGDWLLATLPMFIPASLTFPLMALTTDGSELFRENSKADKERGWFEVLMFPMAANAIVPLAFSIGIAAFSYFGAGRETIFSLVSASVLTVASVVFFATLGTEVPAGVRWTLFIVPFVGELIQMIYVLARGGSDHRHWQLAMATISHLVLVTLFVIFYAAFLHFGIEFLKDKKWGEFFGLFFVWMAITAGAWLLLCLALKDRKIPDQPAQPFITDKRHYVRLLDRTSLFNDPALAKDRPDHLPTLAEHFFPSGRRPLLKLWWNGSGVMSIRSDRDSLIFSPLASPTADAQTILAPLGPMTLAEYARFLTRSVRDGANGAFAGSLKVEVFEPKDLDYEMPPGEVFADHGDDQTDQDKHDAEAVKFKSLPKPDADPYILYHAPRSRLASFFDVNAAVLFDEDRAADLSGPTGSSIAAAGSAVTGDKTTFWTMFRPGDVLSTSGLATDEARIVTTVKDDTHLTVSLPFTAAVVAGTKYARKAQSRTQDTAGPGTISPGVGPIVSGAGFDSFFLPGDFIRAKPAAGTPEERRIAAVNSATQLTLDSAFSPAVIAGTNYERVGAESLQGFPFVADADDFLFSGPSLMDRAADFATLLTLGATSHLMTGTERTAAKVNPVYQVFRNWNLEERGVNEWKMLIGGQAASEKAGDPSSPDPLQPDIPTSWQLLSTKGDDTANRVGWVPLLQKWTDLARRPGIDSKAQTAFFPGDPLNLHLSRAMAYLLDLPEPDPIAP